jgi:hypothetical protein
VDIATITLVVLLAQAIIYGLMLYQMKKANEVTKTAANAAKLSAEAATESNRNVRNITETTERAVVLVEKVIATKPGPAFGLDHSSVVVFTLKNFGHTIAYSVKLSGLLLGPGRDLIPEMPATTIAPQGKASWMTRSLGAWVPAENLKRINERSTWLEYKIDVTYKDAFEREHVYQCNGQYEPALNEFLIIGSTSD